MTLDDSILTMRLRVMRRAQELNSPSGRLDDMVTTT
jgi:hypothetical protein